MVDSTVAESRQNLAGGVDYDVFFLPACARADLLAWASGQLSQSRVRKQDDP